MVVNYDYHLAANWLVQPDVNKVLVFKYKHVQPDGEARGKGRIALAAFPNLNHTAFTNLMILNYKVAYLGDINGSGPESRWKPWLEDSNWRFEPQFTPVLHIVFRYTHDLPPYCHSFNYHEQCHDNKLVKFWHHRKKEYGSYEWHHVYLTDPVLVNPTQIPVSHQLGPFCRAIEDEDEPTFPSL